MKIKMESSRLIKPDYGDATPPPTDLCLPLTPFDTVTFASHVAVIYAFRPLNPTNKTIEEGLRRALAEYREWAGRFVEDEDGRRCILFNDAGMRFVEASCDYPLGYMDRPSPEYRELHPPLVGVLELAQVQLTRFSCGTVVVGFTSQHMVADGLAVSNFLVAWGRATRGLPVQPLPFRDQALFVPRNPPNFQFEHRGVEYTDKLRTDIPGVSSALLSTIKVHKAHFSSDFLLKLKAKASANSGMRKPYTTFDSLIAHLWRQITRARGLRAEDTTEMKIAVNGRGRMTNPRVPLEYFGNLVLWAVPRAKAGDVVRQPLSHAARLIHDAVSRVNDDYFRSFIDYSSSKEKMEGLVPTGNITIKALCTNLEVYSWLRFPFYDLDFGSGCPHMFTPSYFPDEGSLFLVPSFSGNGDIDAFVGLFEKDIQTFEDLCYSLE
ncbi:Agmatine coumaroyltransferase-2 [Nymphaea thermarum]|nr:Agmatine coumaroyltransferase-2 [Nymphaea thermarum]